MAMAPRSPWEKPTPPRRVAWRLLILVALAGGALFALFSLVPPVAWSESETITVARFGLIGLVLLVSAAASRQRLVTMGAGLAAWCAIGLVLIAAYGYRFELGQIWQRVAGELLPSRASESGSGEVSFARAGDQHFRIDALVAGQPVRFLLDTGASGVILTREDAARIGYPPDRLSFTQIFETANGRTRGAPIRLKQIAIGPLVFSDVPASVNEGALRESLLGMRLLEQLSSIEIRNDRLVIRR